MGVLVVHRCIVLLLKVALVHHYVLGSVAVGYLVLHRVDRVGLAWHVGRSLILLDLTLANNVAGSEVVLDLLLLGKGHVSVLVNLLLARLVVQLALLIDVGLAF